MTPSLAVRLTVRMVRRAADAAPALSTPYARRADGSFRRRENCRPLITVCAAAPWEWALSGRAGVYKVPGWRGSPGHLRCDLSDVTMDSPAAPTVANHLS